MVFMLPAPKGRGLGEGSLIFSQVDWKVETSQFLRGWDPNIMPRLVFYYLFDFTVNLFQRVSLYNGWKTQTKNSYLLV